ncbi:tRNA (guanosine(46)-N7)-methyltransferase TrmB [Georgenia sp. Z1491]|uniref:tRNA (guanosine(46)-N7)-methyltransferase TrmB n=1 Tax=Georgenia sp. Z1491 TaxID=3416707 RepID=UPI003CF9CF94
MRTEPPVASSRGPGPDRTMRDGEHGPAFVDARVRSFTRRGTRLKPRLAKVWEERGDVVLDVPMMTETGVADHARLDLDGAFGNGLTTGGRLVVEIGCGAGEQIVHAALAEPGTRFLGLEVWQPGLARTLARVLDEGATNVRLLGVDAEQALPILLPAGSVDELWTFFPDPWRKSKHHKRRIVSPEFAAVVAGLLAPGGTWRLATDWANYAQQMITVLDAAPAFELTVEAGRWPGRTLTRFERRGVEDGREVTDLTAVRRRVEDMPDG